MQILSAIANRLPEKETVKGEKAYKHEMIIMLMIMKFIRKFVVLNKNKTCVLALYNSKKILSLLMFSSFHVLCRKLASIC